MARTIELKWNCGECDTKGILGRHKECPSCGAPREKGEMQMSGLSRSDYGADGRNKAASVTDPELLKKANAGADWFCAFCSAGNIGTGDRCAKCGASRHEDQHESRAKPESPSPPKPKAVKPAEVKPKEEPEEKFVAPRDHRQYIAAAGVVLGIATIVFTAWAFQPHEVKGSVTGASWAHTASIYEWTQISVRKWQDETREVEEIPPVKGSGERAGMTLMGACSEEHHHYEQYQCGTKQEDYECGSDESYSDTCYRTESYVCGETCSDNGNGFATCRDRHCSRQESYSCTKSRYVSKTCQRTVPKYCDRSIEETECTYRTQEWKFAYKTAVTGKGPETSWPNVQLAPLQKQILAGDYSITVAYHDKGENEVHTFKPDSLNSYVEWAKSKDAYLKVTRLGGIVLDVSRSPQLKK